MEIYTNIIYNYIVINHIYKKVSGHVWGDDIDGECREMVRVTKNNGYIKQIIK